MFRLISKITIGNNIFNYVNDIVINENADNFTKTAVLKFPQTFYKNDKLIFDEIKIGDPVKIELGYFPDLKTRFNGYVTRRIPDSPTTIYCEDEAYLYKQKIINPVTQQNTTLKKLIETIYIGKTNIYEPSPNIGTWIIKGQTTFLNVLDELKKTFGTSSFWDLDGVLNIDTQLGENATIAGEFNFNKNLFSDDSLIYQEAAEFKQIIHGYSAKANPKETAIEIYSYYDDKGKIKTSDSQPFDGNINNFSRPGLTKAELTNLCEQRLKKINFTGYTGSFIAAGEPIVKFNQDILLKNIRNTEMNGRYRVKAVTIKFGVFNGYRQEIELSRKISTLQ